MEILTAKGFTDSLAELTDTEQALVADFVTDLQVNGPRSSHAFHRVTRSKDRSLWSIKVSRGLRAIARKSEGAMTLCYVADHNEAYRWAESR